jgi:hypothetical protein
MFKQFQNIFIGLGSAVVLMVGGVLTGTLFTEAKDPLWLHVDSLQQNKFVMLEQSVDSLRHLYDFIQYNVPIRAENGRAANDSMAFKIVAKPFLPTMEFRKFDKYCRQLHENKRMTLGSVTGSGTSTLASRLLSFVASDAGCQMEILCAPMFDLELHKEYIGTNDLNGGFHKGKLLRMWDECRQNPSKKYVCMISGLDKINPETFFGPALWQKMGDERVNLVLGGDTLTIPTNFHLLCIVHTGVSSLIELNNEHFKRLGGLNLLPVNELELLQNLRESQQKLPKKIVKTQDALAKMEQDGNLREAKTAEAHSKLRKELTVLNLQKQAFEDKNTIQKFVYLFTKTNAYISETYSPSHQLGQWNEVRSLFAPSQQAEFLSIFEQHVNAFKPARTLTQADFSPIVYSMQHEGDIQGSSSFRLGIQKFVDLGFLNEAFVAIVSLLLTGLGGWWFIRRKKRLVRSRIEKLYKIIADWEAHTISYETAQTDIRAVKRDIDSLVLDETLDYDAAAFFYAFIGDRLQEIETQQSAQRQFEQLLDTFLEDGVLSDKEKTRLSQVLERIRYQLPAEKYEKYMKVLE